MRSPRRRSLLLLPPKTLSMKQRGQGRNPVLLFLLSLSLFLLLLYYEDVIKTIASFSSSTAPDAAAKHDEVARQEDLPVARQEDVPVAKPTLEERIPYRVDASQVEEAKEEEEQVEPDGGDEEEQAKTSSSSPPAPTALEAKPQLATLNVSAACDLFDGEWVYDDVAYPIYREHECSLLTEQVTCTRNGRRDDSYQKWRWQPRGCNLPRFDAWVMLERLRGKRLMFVGDSLNRNQWESMVCLVQSVIPWDKKKLTKNGSLNVFRAEEYNATVEFYWAPFLVESNSDDPRIHSIPDRIISNSIAKHGRHWKKVDYLIFNTYIWWMNTPKMKILRGTFDRGSTEYTRIARTVAYRRVLKIWEKWVQRNLDPKKTMVFFMSLSPNHMRSLDWDNQEGIKCALETMPVTNLSHPLEIGTDWRLFAVEESVIRSMRFPVFFVRITALSEFRKDAHTSVHTLRQGKLLTPEQQADPGTYADCIHWCLPGLPDTWNEFLYARIASQPWR